MQVDNVIVHQCEICGQILASKEAHYTHVKLSHKMKLDRAKVTVQYKLDSFGLKGCEFCGMEMEALKELIEHVVTYHNHENWNVPMSMVEFRCEQCQITYRSSKLYHRHLKFNHYKFKRKASKKWAFHAEGV